MKVAWGSVVTEEHVWETPAPSRMFWRPDRLTLEYELTSPFLSGEYEGDISRPVSHWSSCYASSLMP